MGIFRVLTHSLVGYHSAKVSNIRQLIDDRDHLAHCSGVLDKSESDIIHDVNRSLRYAEEIQNKIAPLVFEKIWLPLIKNIDQEGYTLVSDDVKEVLRTNFLSVADMEHIFNRHSISSKTYSQNIALLPIIERLSISPYINVASDELDKKEREILNIKYGKEDIQKLNDELTALNMS